MVIDAKLSFISKKDDANIEFQKYSCRLLIIGADEIHSAIHGYYLSSCNTQHHELEEGE